MPSGFGPKLLLYRSRLKYLGNISLSLFPLSGNFLVAKLARLSRVRINAPSPAQTSRGNSRFRFRYYRRYLAPSCSTPRFPRDWKAVVCLFDPLLLPPLYQKGCKSNLIFYIVKRRFSPVLGDIAINRQRVLHRRLQISGCDMHAKLITEKPLSRKSPFRMLKCGINGVMGLAVGWLFSQVYNAGARVKFPRCGVCRTDRRRVGRSVWSKESRERRG